MKWICPNCEYIFDEDKGHPREGFPAGTCFFDIDAAWACPDCGVREQVDFLPLWMYERDKKAGIIDIMEGRDTTTGDEQ